MLSNVSKDIQYYFLKGHNTVTVFNVKIKLIPISLDIKSISPTNVCNTETWSSGKCNNF